MLIELPEYIINEIVYEGRHTTIYKGRRKKDNVPVIIKGLKEQSLTLKQIARIKHEYEIIQQVQSPYIIKAYGLERINERPILILEDFGAQSLTKTLQAASLDLESILLIAIQAAEGIGDLHLAHIIHKDIKPGNIVINPETKKIKIIDFGISTKLSREIQQIVNPDLLEGTLAYISPEQTGRMNRAIDYRTDIYSLGVVLYEMVTGELPYQSKDAMELIHSHIAKKPHPPHEVKPSVPAALSKIIMKCLMKDAEERYHSAFGLKNDLNECRILFTRHERNEGFIPGQWDVYDHFQIPQKLYGREKEIEHLLEIFTRASQGNAEMLLVSGYAGIGKTFLINEVRKPIVQKQGYFISGKFDQFKKNTLYSALIQAFTDLIEQILGEGQQQQILWRNRLLKALKSDGQVLIDVIPGIQFIIGKQPPPPELDPQSTENRFLFLFINFIKVFLHSNHPLVIFLDDLQWADSASLKLLQLLVTDISIKHLLIAGAYRSNEVDAIHPLTQIIKEIQKEKGHVELLQIHPLDSQSIEELVADTFHKASQETVELAGIIYQKTKGNPFFIIQFLKHIYEKGYIIFDKKGQSWNADLTGIKMLHVTDNVAEFMTQKIRNFSGKTQELLKIASAIGNTFDLQTLANVYGAPLEKAKLDLQESLIEELITIKHIQEQGSEGESIVYQFQHDRIQQAAYQLVTKEEAYKLHAAIGESLLAIATPETLRENIIAIVNQLNYSADRIVGEQKQVELAQLNLLAGQKAKDSAAYSACNQYLETGIKLLMPNGWQSQYDLMFSLHKELAISQNLFFQHDEAEKTLNLLLAQAKTKFSRAEVFTQKIYFYGSLGKFNKATESGIQALQLFNIRLSKTPSFFSIAWEYLKIKSWFIFHKVEDIKNLPDLQDEELLLIAKIYFSLDSSFSFPSGPFYLFVIYRLLNFTLKHGISAYSIRTLVALGLRLSSETNQEYKKGYQLSFIAMNIGQTKYMKTMGPASIFFYAGPARWGQSFRMCAENINNLKNRCLEIGDLNVASTSSLGYPTFLLLAGEPLDNVITELDLSFQLLKKLKMVFFLPATIMLREFCFCLKGMKEDPTKILPKEETNSFAIFRHSAFHTWLLYLNEKYDEAIAEAKNCLSSVIEIQSYASVVWNILYYYYALALAEKCSEKTFKETHFKDLIQLQKRIKKWAEACPVNFKHQYLLISAEVARLSGFSRQAQDLYSEAIEAAITAKNIHEVALSWELAARFYLEVGKNSFAAICVKESIQAYERWGAVIKLRMLKEKYADLLAKGTQELLFATQEKDTLSTFDTRTMYTLESKKEDFDITAILRASQALSEEIGLHKLLKKMMHILLVNAGASRIFLILIENENLLVQAEAISDLEKLEILQGIPLDQKQDQLCIAIVHYVKMTGNKLLLNNATKEGFFTHDLYIVQNNVQSVLCIPLTHLGKLIGILYLENRFTKDAFTDVGLRVLSFLISQMAISIENAMFYSDLEKKVQDRTHALEEAQKRLIHHEKMASLGLMTTGIAHEIKNPLNFVLNFSKFSNEVAAELETLMNKNQSEFKSELLEEFKSLCDQLIKFTNDIFSQGKKIDGVVTRMVEHSRANFEKFSPTNINFLIEEALEVSMHEAKIKYPDFSPLLEKDFDPSIKILEIAGHDIQRVITNLLGNACWAVFQKKKKLGPDYIPVISIKTKNLGNSFEIRIRDNGIGISKSAAEKVFTPFYTTKPTGEGVGLGLSLSHSIIVQEHEGTLEFNTREGEFTEFIITLPIVYPINK